MYENGLAKSRIESKTAILSWKTAVLWAGQTVTALSVSINDL